jgi:hypothetical protein
MRFVPAMLDGARSIQKLIGPKTFSMRARRVSAAALLHVLERSIDRARHDPGRKFKPVVLGEIQAAGDIEDGIPDGTTLLLFRETLAKAGLVEKLFERFRQHLEAKGYIARGGQMVDATIVPVPKQRNSRDENDEVKAGKTPEAWEKNLAKNRQKHKDARNRSAATAVCIELGASFFSFVGR